MQEIVELTSSRNRINSQPLSRENSIHTIYFMGKNNNLKGVTPYHIKGWRGDYRNPIRDG